MTQSMSDDDLLHYLYYEHGWPALSASAFAKRVHVLHLRPAFTLAYVTDWAKHQEAVQLTAPISAPGRGRSTGRSEDNFSTVLGYRPNGDWEVDLGDFNTYKEPSDSYRYALIIVDVYSRKILCLQPLKTKTMKSKNKSSDKDEWLPYVKETVNDDNAPEHVNADNEFNKADFKRLFPRSYFYFSQPETEEDGKEWNANPIVERLIRTIKQLIAQSRVAHGQPWYTFLPAIQAHLNETTHSTTGATPNELYENEAVSKQQPRYAKMTVKEGDLVRIRKRQGRLAKGARYTVSNETYTVTQKDKNGTTHVGERFWLKDKEGHTRRRHYKHYQLQPTLPPQTKRGQALETNVSTRNATSGIDRMLRKEKYPPAEQAEFKEAAARELPARAARPTDSMYEKRVTDLPNNKQRRTALLNRWMRKTDKQLASITEDVGEDVLSPLFRRS